MPLTPLPTQTIPLAASNPGPASAGGLTPLKALTCIGMPSATLPLPCLVKMAKRSSTSRHVMQMLRTISTMMIHVMRVIFLSLMLSDRISPRSRKTWQRSLRTWMRGLISRYSRTAV